MNNKKEKLNIISLHKKVALGLSIITMLGSTQPVFAFTPAKASTIKQIAEKADEILNNDKILKHLMGTGYIKYTDGYIYDSAINKENAKFYNGKMYVKDALRVPSSLIEETPWFEIFSDAARYKLSKNSVEEKIAESYASNLANILATYEYYGENKLKEDGEYTIDYTFLAANGEELPGVKDLFSKMSVTKWGNDIDIDFITNPEKTNGIESIYLEPIFGTKQIPVTLGNAINPEDHQNSNAISISIPTELGAKALTGKIKYKDKTGKTLETPQFFLSINWGKNRKDKEINKLYNERTRARLGYWIIRGEQAKKALPDNSKQYKEVNNAISELEKLKSEEQLDMSKILDLALPIYKAEAMAALRTVIFNKVSLGRDLMYDGNITEDNYTKESIENYKKFLEKTDQASQNFELSISQLVEKTQQLDKALNNTILKYNTKKLEDLIEKAKKLSALSDYYTDTSIANLNLEIAKAKDWVEVNKKYAPVINETSDRKVALNNAIENLQLKDGKEKPLEVKKMEDVEVSFDKNSVAGKLEKEAKYIQEDDSYILSFKKDDGYVTGIKYYDKDSHEKEAKILEKETVLGKTVAKKIILPRNYKKEFGLNVLWTDTVDDKLEMGVNLSVKEKDSKKLEPYDVKMDLQLQFPGGTGNPSEESINGIKKLISDTASYNPKTNKLTLTLKPDIQNKSYITNFVFASGIGSDNAKGTNYVEDGGIKIPQKYEINVDIDKLENNTINIQDFDAKLNGNTFTRTTATFKLVLAERAKKNLDEAFEKEKKKLDPKLVEMNELYNKYKYLLSSKREEKVNNAKKFANEQITSKNPEKMEIARDNIENSIIPMLKAFEPLNNKVEEINAYLEGLDEKYDTDSKQKAKNRVKDIIKWFKEEGHSDIDLGIKNLDEVKSLVKLKGQKTKEDLSGKISEANTLLKNSKKGETEDNKLKAEIQKAEGILNGTDTNINSAYNNLDSAIQQFKKAPDQKNDDSNIDQGALTVNVKFLNASQEKLSMADSTLWSKAKLTQDDQKTFWLEIKAVPMKNKENNLTGAITKIEYKPYNGLSFIEAKKLKMNKISLVDGQQKDYPERFKLPLDLIEGHPSPEILVKITYDAVINGQVTEMTHPARLVIDKNKENWVQGFDENEFALNKKSLIEEVEKADYFSKDKDIPEKIKNKLNEILPDAKNLEKNSKADQKLIDETANKLSELNKTPYAILEILDRISFIESNLSQEYSEGKFSKDSLDSIKNLIQNAKEKIKNADNTTNLDDLKNEIFKTDKLKRYNTAKLDKKIQEAESINKDEYTKESYSKLENALSNAKNAIKKHKEEGLSTGNEFISSCIKEIDGAINSLIKVKTQEPEEKEKESAKKALESKIAEAKKIQQANKKQEAFDKLQKAISEVENSKDSINSKEALEAAIAKLDLAISEFNNSEAEVKLNKEALEGKIREAEGLSKEGKSQEAISNLEAAINIAKAKMNAAITQEDLTKALDDLNKAIESFNNAKVPEAKVEKAIYKVPVAFESKTYGGPLKMAGDTLVNEAVLEVNGNTKKLTITLIPSSQEGLTKGSYITSLTKAENDSTPIGEAIMTTAPDGNQRPGQYIIDVSDYDIKENTQMPAGLSAKGMLMTVGVYININFGEKDLIKGSEEESKPQIDKSELKNLFAEIAGMDLGIYTQESRSKLLTALDAANQVLLDDNAMDKDVNRVIEQLKQAKNALVENNTNPQVEVVNKEELKAKIKEAEAKKAQDFTEDSYNNLKAKLDEAKNILNKTDAKRVEVNTAKSNLENAIKGLKKKETPAPNQVNKSELQDLIRRANQISTMQYTDDSVEAFKEALKNANKINKDTNAKQDDVNSAKNRLEIAMNNLKKKVNKVDLGNLIAECDRIKEDDFEYDFNMRSFKTVLSDAKDVYNSSNSTQDQVDYALRNLSIAKSNLVAKKKGHILYEVPVSVQKPSGGESMANKVINPIATVEEKNGRFTYTVQFGRLTMGNKSAGVDTLYIYDGGSKFAASRGSNGTFSWTSNSKVSSQRVSFSVSVMSTAQDAILMFSWGGARETKNELGNYFIGEAPNKKIELDKKDDENKKIEEKKNIENKLNNPKQFRDTNGHWAKVAIDYVVNKGYFYGTSETSFSPNKPITRGQFVTVLGRMLNVNTSIYSAQNFNDVKSSMYYSSYIAWANKMGIVSGVGQGRFAPDKELTREEMAVIMSKFLKVSNKSLNAKGNSNGFMDDGKIESWAKDAVKEMAKLGVVNGMGDGKFAPKSPFTRAQVAQVLFNIDHN